MAAGCARIPLLDALVKAPASPLNEADLNDDFSDKDSGWGTLKYPEGTAGYVKDTYQITVAQKNTDLFITYPRIYVNSEITVSVSRLEGSDNNNYGLVCRYQDNKNFYAGQISSDGYAGIFKMEKGIYGLLGREFMTPVPAILGGGAVNTVTFSCLEDTLTLSVNGEMADEQKDDAFATGENGIIAGNIDGDYGVFQFDDFSSIVK